MRSDEGQNREGSDADAEKQPKHSARKALDAAIAVAGSAVLAGIFASLTNSPQKLRKMASKMSEARRKEQRRRRKDEDREDPDEEARRRDAYFRKGETGDVLLKKEIERSYRTLTPFPDVTFMKRNRPIGVIECRWSSEAEEALFETEYSQVEHWHKWILKIGETLLVGDAYDRSPLTLGPPRKASSFSDRERETLLRLLGGSDGFPEVTFRNTDNDRAIRERLWAEHLASGG